MCLVRGGGSVAGGEGVPGLGGGLLPGGPGLGGVYSWEVCLVRGGVLPAWGVLPAGGGCSPCLGGSPCWGGFSLPGGGGGSAQRNLPL